MEEKRIIILAGNRREYEDYIHSHTQPLRGYKTIYGDYHSMAGVQASEYITIGTFWERKDAKEAYEYAATRVSPKSTPKQQI